ncbi:PTP [Parapoynx stagnalis nucleopolyhedrovirus]|uniref:PTP n=1 Tax=Parapoynx stagnalis nucleopolyhedrovirus TaxID=2993413 RepID=A0A9E7YCC0_9ABAC|nr:PTP [Parapoynx stagnalis nucleopolyhedrovirus]
MFPARWEEYSSYGNVIENTNILCFKTPLRPNVFMYISDDYVWTLNRLCEKEPSLGAIIDLSTSNHYDGKNVKRAGLLYHKLHVPGRVIPNETLVQEFIDTMEDFTKKCPGMLIGVHCTHGVNRTGYMVCKYLQLKLNISPEQAIAMFESARGHKIDRQNYVENLLVTTRHRNL